MNNNIFAVTRVVKDKYLSDFSKIKKEYDESMRELNETYKQNTPKYNEKKSEIIQKYQSCKTDAKTEAKNFVFEQIEDLRQDEIMKVQTLTNATVETINKLSAISTLPVTYQEMQVILDTHSGKNYWIDRKLEIMAEKSGIADAKVMPHIDDRINALSSLYDNFSEYIERYDGDMIYQNELLMSDRTFTELEEQYNNGFSETSGNNFEKSQRIISSVKSENTMHEKAIKLSNAYRLAEENDRDYILYSLISETGDSFDSIVKFAGMESILQDFKENRYQDFDNAVKSISSLSNEPKMASDIIKASIGNQYFKEMLKEKAENGNNDIIEACKNANVDFTEDSSNETEE